MVVFDHAAILVKSIEKTITYINNYKFKIGEIREYPNEGTKEVYVSNGSKYGKMLLMEAIGEGPYKRAIKKRGEGLHHLAIHVSNLEEYVFSLKQSGWYLHPYSIKSLKGTYSSAWLCRPGYPLLIELVEVNVLKDNVTEKDFFLSKVILPSYKKKPNLIKSLRVNNFLQSDAEDITFKTDKLSFRLGEILKL